MDIDRPTALCCVAGATTVTSANGASALYAAQSPADVIPSSFVSRILRFILAYRGGRPEPKTCPIVRVMCWAINHILE